MASFPFLVSHITRHKPTACNVHGSILQPYQLCSESMTSWLRSVVEDKRTERFIVILIIINAVVLGLETSETAMASFGQLLKLVDQAILAVFVVEIGARLIVHQGAFFLLVQAF